MLDLEAVQPRRVLVVGDVRVGLHRQAVEQVEVPPAHRVAGVGVHEMTAAVLAHGLQEPEALAGLAAALVLATAAAYGAERGMRWLEWLRRPGPGQYGLAVLPIYPTRGVFICFAAVGAVGLAGVLLVTDTLGRGRVRAGLACRCGYDLRESPDRCPECGRTFRR